MIHRFRFAGIAVLVLAVGAAATLGWSYWTYRNFIATYPAEASYESWLPGGLILFAPYALLAIVATCVRRSVTLVAFAVELSLTALFWWAASSDAQGALIILWLLPLQILFAALALANRAWAVLVPAAALISFVLLASLLSPWFATIIVGALMVATITEYGRRRRGSAADISDST